MGQASGAIPQQMMPESKPGGLRRVLKWFGIAILAAVVISLLIRHIGIYCFRKDILKKIIRLKPSSLEKAEKLEQLRFLENGFNIDVIISKADTIGVDTMKEFLKVKKIIEDEA